jgi:hypothetical protein
MYVYCVIMPGLKLYRMLCKAMFLTYLQSILYGSHKIKGTVFERTDEMCMGQPHGKFNSL